MNIDIFNIKGSWQEVKDSAMNTIGKDTGKYPDSIWKKKILLSEHSPIRRLTFYWRWKNLMYWVSNHFVRHKYGIEHWISTQRDDRTGGDRSKKPQTALVNHSAEANAQTLINMSRKRLCHCASPETQAAMRKLKDEVSKTEPELASCMVKECIYRGWCPEMYPCGYSNTEQYKVELYNYRNVEVK